MQQRSKFKDCESCSKLVLMESIGKYLAPHHHQRRYSNIQRNNMVSSLSKKEGKEDAEGTRRVWDLKIFIYFEMELH